MATARPVLGGGFYDVRRGTIVMSHGTPLQVAVTTIRDDDTCARQRLLRRFPAVLEHLQHENVEPLLGTVFLGSDLCVLTLWPDGGDLRHYLAVTPNANVREIACKIANAVRYLHTRRPRVVHGNLDLSNVFMHGDTPRLWDFSLCRFDPAPDGGELADLTPAGDREGMITAMAPELHIPGPITTASDVYAFGILLFELFARHRPFPSSPRIHASLLFCEGQRPSRTEIPSGPCGDAAWEIIERCWAQDPAARPDMAQVERDLRRVVS